MDSTSPKKSQSQPLHNFDLPNLKWKTEGNSSTSHTRRRPAKSPAPSASPVRPSPDSLSAPPPRLQSPPRGSPATGGSAARQIPVRGESFKPPTICERFWKSALSGDSGRQSLIREDAVRRGHSSPEAEGSKKRKAAPVEFRRNDNYRNFASGSMRVSPLGIEQKKPKQTEVVAGNNIQKLVIKNIRKDKNPMEVNPVEEPLKNEIRGDGKIAEIGNEETRVWALRPRNPKQTNNTTVREKEINGSGKGEEKKEKKNERKKLSISIPLSKAEIEEDIYALSGSKPSRRPKKRAKNIQRNLDSVFPGLWLVSITPESYKVSESSLKG